MSMVFEDRVSTYPNRYTMTDENGNVSHVLLERDDEPITTGTPLNAETFNRLVSLSYGVAESGQLTGYFDLPDYECTWNYIKFHNGKCECWCDDGIVKANSGGASPVVSGLYVKTLTVYLPENMFIAPPIVNAQFTDVHLCDGAPFADSNTAFYQKVHVTAERYDSPYGFKARAVGRWK